MVFINQRLGNGFVIQDADSSKDQEHYFGGTKKHIEVIASGSSGSLVQSAGGRGISTDLATGHIETDPGGVGQTCTFHISSSLYVVVGDTEIDIDGNEALIRQLTGDGYDTEKPKLAISFSVEASSSAGPFVKPLEPASGSGNPAKISLIEGNNYTSLGEIRIHDYDLVEELGAGWYKATFNISLNVPPIFPSSLRITGSEEKQLYLRVFMEEDAGVWFLRNFKVDYFQELSDGGVEVLKNIENQDIDKVAVYVNRDVLKGIE